VGEHSITVTLVVGHHVALLHCVLSVTHASPWRGKDRSGEEEEVSGGLKKMECSLQLLQRQYRELGSQEWTVERKIGGGNFGDVFLASLNRSGEKV
jgi:hypothetical protein